MPDPATSSASRSPVRLRLPTAAATDLALLGAVTVLLRVPAFLSTRHLTFDDGVFGASAVAMRDGDLPFRDVFSSQGPLFLPLVWAADLLGFRTPDAPRLLSMVSALVVVGATYLAGRRITGRAQALLAAGLVTTSGTVLWVTGPLAADAPALALSMVALTLALSYRESPSAATAVGMGLAVSATMSVKALYLSIGLPVLAVVLFARRPRHLAYAIGAALALGLALALPWGLADVWDQSVDYHLDAAGDRTPGANFNKVVSTLGDRDLPLVVASGLALAAGLVRWRRPRLLAGMGPEPTEDRPPALPSPDLLLGLWLAGSALVLLAEHPLWRPHLSMLIPPAALLVARHAPPWRALAVAAIVVVPYHLVHVWPVLWPEGRDGDEAAVVVELDALPDGAWAISDDPGIVWRAGRRTPADLVDGSRLRIDSERLTPEGVAAEAADPHVCAVVVWSSRFGAWEDLPALLAEEGYEPALTLDDDRVVYVRPDCEAPT